MEQTIKNGEFFVRGMHCASCSANAEKAMTKTPGVTRAEVNLTTEKATVEFDSAVTDMKKIKKAVEQLGFKTEDVKAGKGFFRTLTARAAPPGSGHKNGG